MPLRGVLNANPESHARLVPEPELGAKTGSGDSKVTCADFWGTPASAAQTLPATDSPLPPPKITIESRLVHQRIASRALLLPSCQGLS